MTDNKVFKVYYINNYDNQETVAFFTTEEKARVFIKSCTRPFYKGIILYDYHDYEMHYDEYSLNEFDDIVFKK